MKITLIAAIMIIWIIIWTAFIYFYTAASMLNSGSDIDEVLVLYIPFMILLTSLSFHTYNLLSF